MIRLNEKFEEAEHLGLRSLPVSDPEFETAIAALYRNSMIYTDLPLSLSDSERIEQLKKRFQVYWTYDALEAVNEDEASNWRLYFDTCLDSPAFLDSENVAVMIDQIAMGVGEGTISFEQLTGRPAPLLVHMERMPD